MKGFSKVIFLSLMTSLAALLFVGCSSSKETDTIRVAEVTRSIFYAPQYVAISEGFFEEEGIEIDLTTTWGGDTTMTTLLANGADVALVGAETSIYVYAQGANDPPINFAALTQTDGTFLVSREPIENFDWDMLRGSTFLGQRKGGMPQMVGEHVLRKHGINPQNDLNLIQNIDFGNIPSAFASGTGQFVQLFEPTATQFELEGLGHIVASFGAESGTVPYTGFMAKQSYIEKNGDVLERFTRALYKAQQWVQSSSTEEIAKSIQPFFSDTDMEVIKSVVENYKSQGSYATSPRIKEEAWENLHIIMDQAGELPMHVNYQDLVNTDIADKVTK
ncbi:ABC transporter substrate-binding protein [Anaerobacillus alkaliphilus]|uniref:ABC transporter substrate-binding protein n=1 Tax=Anaerobacillus alkaliphilus TaxID=1548597 RepID=A0A4Q0VRQ3_9BACI|nr:ABC transporter substrate-binding protein [Anaerobacillus alkaliphilus]RXI98665.1 ABC transporter substrate-binding protein [Anaerobacillus alkaliphilus]